jgi:hypothetical protein
MVPFHTFYLPLYRICDNYLVTTIPKVHFYGRFKMVVVEG